MISFLAYISCADISWSLPRFLFLSLFLLLTALPESIYYKVTSASQLSRYKQEGETVQLCCCQEIYIFSEALCLLLPGTLPDCVSPRICRVYHRSSTWSSALDALTVSAFVVLFSVGWCKVQARPVYWRRIGVGVTLYNDTDQLLCVCFLLCLPLLCVCVCVCL